MSWTPDQGTELTLHLARHDTTAVIDWLETYAQDVEGVHALLLALPELCQITVKAAMELDRKHPIAVAVPRAGASQLDAATLLQARANKGQKGLDAAVLRLLDQSSNFEDGAHLGAVVIDLLGVLSKLFDELRERQAR